MTIDDKIRHIQRKKDHAGQIQQRLKAELEHFATILESAERLADQVPDPAEYGIAVDVVEDAPLVSGARPAITGTVSDYYSQPTTVQASPYAKPAS